MGTGEQNITNFLFFTTIHFKFLADGAYGETGGNAAFFVVVESKSACVLVTVLHQLLAAHNVQELTRRPSSATVVYHAQVRKMN